MAIAYVRKGTNSKTSSSTSLTVSINTDPGNLLVATCVFVNGSSSTALSSVSDTAGNTWILPSSMSDSNPPAAYVGGLGCAIAYTNNADEVTSVTFHYPSAAKVYVVVSEYSGAATSSVVHDSGRAVSSSTPTIFNPAHGVAVAAACTSNASSITGGFTSLLNTSGNLAGYRLPGTSGDNDSMGWSPSQNAAAGIISFNQATATTIQGTATLTETESLTGAVSLPLGAFLIEEESLSAVSSSNPQLGISAVPTDQTDAYGIPIQHGMTAYHWPSSTATQYDRYASVQDGQLTSGPYNAPADVNLYRASANLWKTDDSFEVGSDMTIDGALIATGRLGFVSWTPVLNGGGSATFSTRDGWYLRLGDLIFFNAYLVASAAGSGSTQLSITLPVTPYRLAASRRQIYPGYLSGSVGAGGQIGALACITLAGGTVGIDQITMPNGVMMTGSHLTNSSNITVQGIIREA